VRPPQALKHVAMTRLRIKSSVSPTTSLPGPGTGPIPSGGGVVTGEAWPFRKDPDARPPRVGIGAHALPRNARRGDRLPEPRSLRTRHRALLPSYRLHAFVFARHHATSSRASTRNRMLSAAFAIAV